MAQTAPADGTQRQRTSLTKVSKIGDHSASDGCSDMINDENRHVHYVKPHQHHHSVMQAEDDLDGEDSLDEELAGLTYFGLFKMSVAVVLHGFGTGLVGIFVYYLIEKVQLVGFGAEEGGFLHISTSAPVWRRLSSVIFGGIFSALAWYWLRGCEPRFVPVDASMDGAVMPPHTTIVNAMIQDISVAFGGSFGREAAPREIAAMLGGTLADLFRVAPSQRRILVACGTGAGLAAVYSVPISGTLYIIEHILCWELTWHTVVPSVVSSVVATITSYNTVAHDGLYVIAPFYNTWSWGLLLWAIVVGPVCGFVAAYFIRFISLTRQFRPTGRVAVKFEDAVVGQWIRAFVNTEDMEHIARFPYGAPYQDLIIVSRTTSEVTCKLASDANNPEAETVIYAMDTWPKDDDGNENVEGPRDWNILILMPSAFFVLAVASAAFPTLLGNGRALAQVAMYDMRWISQLIMLFFLKAFMTGAAIGAGADGGTLTPSVALGATLGSILGKLLFALQDHFDLQHIETPPLEHLAVVSACAFLGSAMKAPVTGMWLILEFTAQGVPRQAFSAAFHGDFQPLLDSKFAMGSILPCGTAVFLAHRLFRATNRKPSRRSSMSFDRRTTRAGSRIFSDMDLGHDYDDHSTELKPETKAMGFKGFHTGLLVNTCITVFAAGRNTADVASVTIASVYGLVFAPIVGLIFWGTGKFDAEKTEFQRITSEGQEPLLGAQTRKAASRGQAFTMALCYRKFKTILFVGGVTFLGATMPAVPWALRIWAPDPWTNATLTPAEEHHGWILCSIVTVGCVLLATAMTARGDALMPEYGEIGQTVASSAIRPCEILRRVVRALVVTLVSGAIGIACARLGL